MIYVRKIKVFTYADHHLSLFGKQSAPLLQVYITFSAAILQAANLELCMTANDMASLWTERTHENPRSKLDQQHTKQSCQYQHVLVLLCDHRWHPAVPVK